MMEKKAAAIRILQFKITLMGSHPTIWRRIQIPAQSTFWDLHVAIQCAMDGWLDYHLHQFTIRPPQQPLRDTVHIGIPMSDDDDWGEEKLVEWKVALDDWFPKKVKQAIYTYDFGDSWDHSILLERELVGEPGQKYPRCIAGKRACPPEDCGSLGGYENLIKIVANPKNKRHKEVLEWLQLDRKEEFRPEHFDPSAIVFDNPSVRLRELKKHLHEM